MSEIRCARCCQIPSCGCAEYLQKELSQEQARGRRLQEKIKWAEQAVGVPKGVRDVLRAALENEEVGGDERKKSLDKLWGTK